MARRVRLASLLALGAVLLTGGLVQSSPATTTAKRDGGTFRVSLTGPQFDHIDPALAYTPGSWALLDTVCARLMTYPDKPPPAGFRVVPEVAAGPPRVSRDRRVYTFTIRNGFRFSNGQPVLASAFARAINRTLALGLNTRTAPPSPVSPAAQYTRDIVGAGAVLAGRRRSARGVVARGRTLVVRFTRPVPDFAAQTTMPFFCAVPPSLPVDPEGRRTFPGAGPYYVAQYRQGEQIVLRRNRFYGGKRPHHVDRFVVDLRPTSQGEVLDRVERGLADWGYAVAPIYFEPGRNLRQKYGVNKSRFFVRPGFTLRMLVLNSSRPLFRDNPQLRRAVNYALDREEMVAAVAGAQGTGRLTDQYLQPRLPGFRDAAVYPLRRPNVRRARALARGHTRSGKATFYVPGFPPPLALAQVAKRQLARIGIDVTLRPIPFHVTNSGYLGRLGARGEPW
ncbi:MAG: ABC transporter substrate-binding protein, partial [Actinomycetota bacterium]|nr:ABC transporter substrate-binding protein [Actinomycetota bacterium]